MLGLYFHITQSSSIAYDSVCKEILKLKEIRKTQVNSFLESHQLLSWTHAPVQCKDRLDTPHNPSQDKAQAGSPEFSTAQLWG